MARTEVFSFIGIFIHFFLHNQKRYSNIKSGGNVYTP